nr:MAG TPA: hypothetical protein [Caudoviricetes sp.]
MSISFDELQWIDKTLTRVNNIIRKRYDNHVFHSNTNFSFSGSIRVGETLSLYKPRVKMICLRKDRTQYVFRFVVIFNQCQSKNLWFLRNTWSIHKPLEASLKEKFDEAYGVNKITINQSFIQHVLHKHFLESDWISKYGVSTLGCSPEEFFYRFGLSDGKSIPLSSILDKGLIGAIDTTIFREYWDAPFTKSTDINDVYLQNIFVYNGFRSCYSLGNTVRLSSANIAMDSFCFLTQYI